MVSALAILIAAAGAVSPTGCRGRARSQDSTTASADRTDELAPSEPGATAEISLLFPSPDDDLLHVEKRQVAAITSPQAKAAQCLEELLKGPSPGLLAALPDGVKLRQVYVLEDNTAWVDLSSEILKIGGGSRAELQTIYAVVDTLALNVPQIARAGILVDGEPRATLAGHISLVRTFVPEYGLVEASARPGGKAAPPAAGSGSGAPGASGAGSSGDGSATSGATGETDSTGADQTGDDSGEDGSSDGGAVSPGALSSHLSNTSALNGRSSAMTLGQVAGTEPSLERPPEQSLPGRSEQRTPPPRSAPLRACRMVDA